MTAAVKQDQHTYLPSADNGQLAQVHDFLAAHEAAGRGTVVSRYLLVGAELGDQVELPEEVHRLLLQVVDALSNGLAVTVAPQTMTLTTQQAADLLGVSRPTLIKILDSGGIDYQQINTHRRLRLSDVLAYRDRRRTEQYAALAATSIDLDDTEDPETALQRLREAKRIAAERRRAAVANT